MKNSFLSVMCSFYFSTENYPFTEKSCILSGISGSCNFALYHIGPILYAICGSYGKNRPYVCYVNSRIVKRLAIASNSLLV